MKKLLANILVVVLLTANLGFTYGLGESTNGNKINFSLEGYEGIEADMEIYYDDYSLNPKNSKNDIYNAKIIDLNSPYINYREPSWFGMTTRVKYYEVASEAFRLGFINQEELEKIQNLLDTYVEKLKIDLDYRLSKGLIEDADYGSMLGNLRNTEGALLNSQGEPIYLCYMGEHIKAAIDLMIYGIVESSDSVLDLRALAKKSDATKLLVRAFGLEDEAIKMDFNSPYVDVPDEVLPYVGMAYEKGWFGKVANGTKWDDSEINPNIFGEMFARAKGIDLEEERISGDNLYFEISVFGRIGTFYDMFKSRVRLQQGEALRNCDLIWMLRTVMNEKTSRYNVNIVENLVEKKLISREIAEYMKYQDFYMQYDNKMPFIQSLVYQYSKSGFNNVNGVIKQDFNRVLVGDSDPSRIKAAIYIDGEYVGASAMKSSAKRVLMDLGISNSKAEKAVEDAINGGTYADRIIFYIENDVEVSIGSNNGYMSEVKNRRVGPYMYIKFYK